MKLDDIIAISKMNELIAAKKEDNTSKIILTILAIVGAIASVAAIAYAVYRFMTPDYLEDFDDDFDDDFDADFFADEEE